MIEKIESLRKQPKHIRNRYAFWIAASITGIIVLVWGLTLPARFENLNETAEVSEQSEDPGRISQAWDSIVGRAKETFAALNIKTVETVPPEESPKTNEIDFRALLASSTQNQANSTGSTTASTTASTTVATTSATTTPSME